MVLKLMGKPGETTLIIWKRQVKVEEWLGLPKNLRIPKAINKFMCGEQVVVEPGEMLLQIETKIGTRSHTMKQKENEGQDMQDEGDQK